MTIWRLDIGYDGSGFHGYARQPGVRTVQGTLEDALFRHTGPVETAVAGRTDKGVHATGQVVSFGSEADLDPDRLTRSLNRMVGPEIVVWRATAVAAGFDARFSATGRRYHYLVLNREVPDPFLCRRSWHVEVPLDLAAMAQAAEAFRGERDFAALCRRSGGRSTVRDVRSVSWDAVEDDLLRFEVAASSFCHQMVRSMVAIAVDVGRGRIPIDAAAAVVASRDRSRGRGVAPPQGLTLVGVDYG
jgi:tRNA pseudouridine38-40 synthase